MLLDPTPAEWLKDQAPFVVSWCEHMEDPKAGAPFAALPDLEPTLAPLFAEDVGKTYLPWAKANAAAVRTGAGHFSVTLEDGAFEQSAQKHAADAFAAVDRQVSRTLKDCRALQVFLGETHCLDFFRHAGKAAEAEAS